MVKNMPDWVEKRRDLRGAAESILSNVRVVTAQPEPTEILLNELLIHKVELEVQLEELRRTSSALEEARDRYRELYEFSPVGYVTVTRGGMVVDVNQTAAGLLRLDRQALGAQRFLTLVAPEDHDRWARLFKNTMEPSNDAKRSFCLSMRPLNDAAPFNVYVECQRQSRDGSEPVIRLALIDSRKFTAENVRLA